MLAAALGAVLLGSRLAAPSAAPAAAPISVAVVWNVAAPAYADPAVRAAEVALTAPAILGAPLRAARAHPGARFAIAIDPDELAGLERAASGATLLDMLVRGHAQASDPRVADLLRALGHQPVVSSELARMPAARRFSALAGAAPLALAGEAAARFSARDLADYAGTSALLWLAASGATAGVASQLASTDVDAHAALVLLSRADASVLALLKSEVAGGSVELVAKPAGDPVLPLLIDSAGKSSLDPYVVEIKASADAGRLVDDAIAAVQRFQPPRRAVGVYSPYGAYDDSTADLLSRHRAAFGLFSDRVLAGAGAGSSAESVASAEAAAFHPYLLQFGKDRALAAMFWTQDDSDALSATPTAWPASAMGDRLIGLANDAASAAAQLSGARLLVISIDADGPWGRRADRQRVVDEIAARLSDSPGIAATTPGSFARAHTIAAVSYGFPAGSSAGSFALWMGSRAQASLWSALVAARSAAGGAASLDRAATREPLLAAEAGRWFESVALPQSTGVVNHALAQYRDLLAQLYRAAGKPVPVPLAPVKLETPAVLATPVP